ncbi:MAG: DUF58 domain-containing protein [Bacteroidota bacterium]
MEGLKHLYRNIFLQPRLYISLGVVFGCFILSYQVAAIFPVAQALLGLLIALLLVDIILLYWGGNRIMGNRILPEKFSNGDENEVNLQIANGYSFAVNLKVLEEYPVQFQEREKVLKFSMQPGEKKVETYTLRPVTRGEYHFGYTNVFATTFLGLISRRFQVSQEEMVPTYPSFIQMRKYQLLAISNRLTEVGVKKIRRLGHTTEFEQIKEYVGGDDYRTINWKATARSGKLMVNQYMDERAQHVYCLIDKSRPLKMPFEGMSLLDYGINASLVLSNIAIYRQDKAGIITFSEKVHSLVPARRQATQMNRIMEVLYNEKTAYKEADYQRLYATLKQKISHRSLLILFTNFESLSAMRRQLPYLKQLARQHLLVAVIFENTELRDLLKSSPHNTEEIYIKAIGENFAFTKQQIVRELSQYGIMALLTPPEQLTVNTINKYLEIKSRGMT